MLLVQILRGMYATYLKIWFSYFPRDSFLILNSVEFFEDNRAVLRKVREMGNPLPSLHRDTLPSCRTIGSK